MAQVNPIPQGLHTVTPNLVVRECAKAIAFYKRALDAQEIRRSLSPDGKSVWHCELRIGDSTLFVNDEMGGATAPPPGAPSPFTLWLYVRDCDAAHRRAIAAGARETHAPTDMFWGDRCSAVTDPYGYQWSFATHQKDLTDEEVKRGGEAFARQLAAQPERR
ncbi:MAG TPA: VOC family protein [Anaeromyxobacteraceae bacterium]|nr:VOC family protein [Anaeromyxobacteraceae bacterium]